MARLEGGCRCGQIRYTITSEPKFSFACHCIDCQQLSASAFSLGFAVDADAFAVTTGEPSRWTKTGSSGKPSHQFTCPKCSGWTHTQPESTVGIVIVRPTTLDESDWYRPVAEIFTRSALAWAKMPVALSYETEFENPKPLAAAYAAAGISPSAT